MKDSLKIKIIVLFFGINNLVNAQTNLQFGQKMIGDQKAGIYKTYDDLASDKIEFKGEQDQTKWSRSWIMLGGKFVMFKKADFYGYKDYFGNRYRVFDGKNYNVLSYGKMFLYSVNYSLNCRTEGTPKTPTERCIIGTYCNKCPVGQRYQDGSVELYYTTTPDGPLVELKKWHKLSRNEIANLFFTSNESIKSEFMADTKDDYSREDKGGALNDLERLIFYLNKLNGITP